MFWGFLLLCKLVISMEDLDLHLLCSMLLTEFNNKQTNKQKCLLAGFEVEVFPLQARHHIVSLRNSFYLLLCCQLCIVLSFILSLALLLPPPLAPPHLLWLLLVALPLLAAGLMGNPVDPKIMATTTNKNKEHVNQQVCQLACSVCVFFV